MSQTLPDPQSPNRLQVAEQYPPGQFVLQLPANSPRMGHSVSSVHRSPKTSCPPVLVSPPLAVVPPVSEPPVAPPEDASPPVAVEPPEFESPPDAEPPEPDPSSPLHPVIGKKTKRAEVNARVLAKRKKTEAVMATAATTKEGPAPQ